MTTKPMYAWGEEYAPTHEAIVEHIVGFIVGELNNQHLGGVTGPNGEEYVVRVVVTLEPKAK